MLLPDGYIGKGWIPVVNSYQSYRDARRLRKWIKEHPDYNLHFEAVPDNTVIFYAVVPSMKWNTVYDIPMPDAGSTTVFLPHTTNWNGVRPSGITMHVEVSAKKKPPTYIDSEGMIKTPL